MLDEEMRFRGLNGDGKTESKNSVRKHIFLSIKRFRQRNIVTIGINYLNEKISIYHI